MFGWLAQFLAMIYKIVPNYAFAIMLLTLGIMVLLMPLTLKGTRSMIAMQRLQPEIKKLQEKHKDDRQRMNEEVLKFYSEHKINPVAGCLPLLLQMPVFFVLYRVLYGLTRRATFGKDMGSAVNRIATKGNSATFPQFGHFDPKYLSHTSRMYVDLSHSNKMMAFGIDLSTSALKALQTGFTYALPFLVVVALVAATSYIQQKQVSGRMPQSQVNPQQQMLLKVMPGFFAVISLNFPGGVVLYFLVSNLFRVGQQAFITRTMYQDGSIAAPIATTARVANAEPQGIMGKLGFSKDALPDIKGAKAGTASKGSASKGSGSAKGATATPTKPARGAGAVAKPPAGGNGRGAITPSRSAPVPPANRSRNKKKRK